MIIKKIFCNIFIDWILEQENYLVSLEKFLMFYNIKNVSEIMI